MTTKQVQLRRGTTAETNAFTGAAAEVTVDTTKKVLVVHDNATAGGYPANRQPNMTTAQRDAITGWKKGDVIYNTTTNRSEIHNGTTWEAAGGDNLGNHTATEALKMAGHDIENAGTVTATEFVGSGAGLTNLPSAELTPPVTDGLKIFYPMRQTLILPIGAGDGGYMKYSLRRYAGELGLTSNASFTLGISSINRGGNPGAIGVGIVSIGNTDQRYKTIILGHNESFGLSFVTPSDVRNIIPNTDYYGAYAGTQVDVVISYDGTTGTVATMVNNNNPVAHANFGPLAIDDHDVILYGSMDEAYFWRATPFNGRIGNFSVYNRALSETEMHTLSQWMAANPI